jgi:hypothetical protein
MEAPGHCSPSRNVVSNIIIRFFFIILILILILIAFTPINPIPIIGPRPPGPATKNPTAAVAMGFKNRKENQTSTAARLGSSAFSSS